MNANDLKDLVPWASAIIAFGAFICATYTARQTTRSRQWEVLDRTYSRIMGLEEKFLTAKASGTTPDAAFAWRVSFMNTLEYLAFSINARHIRDPRLSQYLERPVLVWYDEIFLRYAERDEAQNPDIYPELRCWVERVRAAKH